MTAMSSARFFSIFNLLFLLSLILSGVSSASEILLDSGVSRVVTGDWAVRLTRGIGVDARAG